MRKLEPPDVGCYGGAGYGGAGEFGHGGVAGSANGLATEDLNDGEGNDALGGRESIEEFATGQ